MTSAALLAGVVAPVAVTTVSANSKNLVDKVLYVDDDYESTYGSGNLNYLHIAEDDIQFDGNDTFRLTMPSGAKWLDDVYTTFDSVWIDKDGKLVNAKPAGPAFKVASSTESDLELQIDGTWDGSKDELVKVPLYFEVDGGEGELKVSVDSKGSTLTSGQYTFAVVGDGNTTASISKVETIGDGGKIGTIRIDETSIGALYEEEYDINKKGASAKEQQIKLRLPSDFEWKSAVEPTVGGGFIKDKDGNIKITDYKLENDKRDLVVKFKFDGKPGKVGTFYISGLEINADKDADFGEVEVDVSGDEVTSTSLVVANYKEYGTSAKLEDDAPTLIAGRNNADTKDLKLAEFTLKEEVPNSWLTDRSVEITLPSWVKIVGADITGVKGFKDNNKVESTILDEIDGDDNAIDFKMPEASSTTAKREMKIKFYVSIEADKSGDITAALSGRAGLEGEIVLGKAVTPVTVETTKSEVRTGVKGQAAADIIITENAKEAFAKDGQVRVWLPSSVEFGSTPKVEVVEGNVEIDQDSVRKSGSLLTFTIDSESTKASKIKISGVTLDLDRTVAEGNFNVKVGGSALIMNDEDSGKDGLAFGLGKDDADKISIGKKEYTVNDTGSKINLASGIDVGEFDKDNVANIVYGTVVTPAEGNVSAQTVTLTIGSDTMKVGDKEVAIDAAPYIEASTGRTYLPLRAIANAVGASSVEWDNASRTATVIKGGLVAQMTIGQNAYVLNGAKVGMDGKAQINKERTFLPVRALGNALGATVEWDAATQTVTIK